MPKLQATQIPVTPFQQNCALIWDADSGRGVVVDPGGDVPRILAALDEAAFRVDRILLTHGHLDHAGGAAELKRELEARQGGPVPIEGPDSRAPSDRPGCREPDMTKSRRPMVSGTLCRADRI